MYLYKPDQICIYIISQLCTTLVITKQNHPNRSQACPSGHATAKDQRDIGRTKEQKETPPLKLGLLTWPKEMVVSFCPCEVEIGWTINSACPFRSSTKPKAWMKRVMWTLPWQSQLIRWRRRNKHQLIYTCINPMSYPS